MQAAKRVGHGNKKNSGNFSFAIHLYESGENFPADELDPRDWILTPEIYHAVKKVESSFNLAGNCAGNRLRLTHSLKSFLINLQRGYPPAKIDQIGASIFRCFTVFFTKLSSYPAGRQRAIAAYRLLDQELEISKSENTTCHKGCAACCHYLIKDITHDEADLLAWLIKNGARIDRRLLARQAAMSSRKKTHRQTSGSAFRCLFLGRDNLCSIYEFRPMVCRKYAVTSSPQECSKKQGKVSQVPLIAEEVVVSATLSCRGNHHGPMPQLLSQALQRENPVSQNLTELNIIRIRERSAKRPSEFEQLYYSKLFAEDLKHSAFGRLG